MEQKLQPGSAISLDTYLHWKKHLKLMQRLSFYFLFFMIVLITTLIFMLTNKTFRSEFDNATLLNNGIGFLFLIFLIIVLILYALIVAQAVMLIMHNHNVAIEPLHHHIMATAISGLLLPWLTFIVTHKTLALLEKVTHEKRQSELNKLKQHFNNENIDIIFHW